MVEDVEDFTGENDDCAELGRSGRFLAAATAFRCAKMASRIDDLPGGRPGLAFNVVLPDKLDTDEANEPAVVASGFLESFSSWPLDFTSRLFMILRIH